MSQNKNNRIIKSNNKNNKTRKRKNTRKNTRTRSRSSSRSNPQHTRGGAILKFDRHSISPYMKNNNTRLQKNGPPVLRMNNYICLKESTISDITNIFYELFARRIVEGDEVNRVDRDTYLDLSKYYRNLDGFKRNMVDQYVYSNKDIRNTK